MDGILLFLIGTLVGFFITCLIVAGRDNKE